MILRSSLPMLAAGRLRTIHWIVSKTTVTTSLGIFAGLLDPNNRATVAIIASWSIVGDPAQILYYWQQQDIGHLWS